MAERPSRRYLGRVQSDGAVAVVSARLGVLISALSGAIVLASAGHTWTERTSTVATIASWSLWAVTFITAMVPSTASLTVLRSVAPLQVPLAVWWLAASGRRPGTIIFVAVAVAGALGVASAALGAAFVQASAYGDERRFLLRPPAAFLVPAVLGWLAWAGALSLLVATATASSWWRVGLFGVLTVVLTWLIVPRLHVLSRRWLVAVPAGLVVHDQVVLSETVMIEGGQVRRASLARDGTTALDISGPAAGHLLEIGLVQTATMILRDGRTRPPRAVHVRSFLVAPSRPGAVLALLTGSPGSATGDAAAEHH